MISFKNILGLFMVPISYVKALRGNSTTITDDIIPIHFSPYYHLDIKKAVYLYGHCNFLFLRNRPIFDKSAILNNNY